MKNKPRSLESLLDEVLTHFQQKPDSGVYAFSLNKAGSGWVFRVIDDWNTWMAANRQVEFGPHPSPHKAVEQFLAYVRENKLMVAQLQE